MKSLSSYNFKMSNDLIMNLNLKTIKNRSFTPSISNSLLLNKKTDKFQSRNDPTE